MRKLVESTFVTLDAVISNPQEFSPPYWDEEHAGYARELLKGIPGNWQLFAASGS